MPAHPYSLPRDKTESERLEFQHSLILASTGYLLHPRIAAAIPSHAEIADLATGTGIWMQQLSKDGKTPDTWSFTGFDMSDAQFPADHGKCSYEVLDLLDDIPEHWKGKYDVVNLRYLICALAGKSWEVVASNALKLLKPGGWIQWHESNFGRMDALQNVPDTPINNTRSMIAEFHKAHRRHGKLLEKDVTGLARLVESVGCSNVKEDIISSDRDPNTRLGITWNGNKAIRASMLHLAACDPSFGLTSEEVNEMGEAAERECADGKVYHRFDMHIVTAQKM